MLAGAETAVKTTVETEPEKRINIVDFRARTDRIVYILKYENQGYAIINNNVHMNESADNILPGQGDRDILVARLITNDWEECLKKGLDMELDGFEHSTHISNCYLGLVFVRGTIQTNNTSYTTRGVRPKKDKVELSEMRKLLHPEILNSLEHFLVPKSVADEIRLICGANVAANKKLYKR